MHTEVRCGVLPPKSTGVSLSMNVEPVVQLGYLIGHAEAHNWVILSCWVHVSHVAKHNWVISCAAHNWVILSCWVRVSHGGNSTTGLFHSSTQLGYFMRSTQLGYFVKLGSSLARWHNWVIS